MLLLLLLLLLPLLLLLLLLLLQRPALPLTFNTFCTICAFFRLCNCPWQIMRLVHFTGPNIAVYQNSQTCGMETAIWILNYSFFFVNCAYCKERKITKLSSLLSVPTTGHSWRPVISCRWGYKLIFQWNDVSCSDIAWREIRKMRTPIITTFFILQ